MDQFVLEAFVSVLAQQPRVVSSFDEITEDRYRQAAAAFRERCRAWPSANRCRIAILVGADAFKVTVDTIRAHDRDIRRTKIRGGLMAFSRVISPSTNSLTGIGRCFDRNHATVLHAVRKYGDAIAEIIKCPSY